MRAAFDIYWLRGKVVGITLWGSEEQYRAAGSDEFKRLWPGPFCDSGGKFRWEFWEEYHNPQSLNN